jgi:hypothetical protein
MFRSGRLTKARLNQILRRAEATPHNLRVVAKACMILPQDLLAWFAAGQDPQCTDPLMVELAWEINKLRADVAARTYARIEAAATGGKKTKTVTKPHPLALEAGREEDDTFKPIVEVTVEDVLPAAWAIEKIDALAAASHWEISPDAEQAEELHRMMRELAPTPLLPSGVDEVVVPDLVLHPNQGDVEVAPLGDVVDVVGVEGVQGGQGGIGDHNKGTGVAEGDVLSNNLHSQTLTDD